MPAQLVLLIGNKGSGKSTLMTAIAQLSHQVHPKIPQVSNTRIQNTTYYPEILKFFAMKLARHDTSYMEAFVDEAATSSDLEARGSFREEKALPTYLFALSRKLGINCWLATQLMSMVDKRVQWIGDWLILCEAKPDSDDPEYFQYTVYDPNNVPRNWFTIEYSDADQLIFKPGLFKTDEVPFEELLIQAFTEKYSITDKDLKQFDRIIAGGE